MDTHKQVRLLQEGQSDEGKRYIRWTGRLGTSLLICLSWLILIGGCISDRFGDGSKVSTYQKRLAGSGPQPRISDQEPPALDPLGLLKPLQSPQEAIPSLRVTVDPNTGRKSAALTIEQAITRALANSPEIRIVSFDPEIARQDVVKAVGDFDPTAFSRVNYEDQDNPRNSIFEPGRAETRLLESGIRQRTILGSEWSASYALSRIWDDLVGRTLPTRYEPMVIFELRQPLLRDAGTQVNLAGVNVAKLNYEAALLGFRERAEAVSAAVITAYWRLVQAHRDTEIQRQLVGQTNETLKKVEGRRDIDATDVQTKQAAAYARSREATLLELEKQAVDVQSVLARLISDPCVNTASEVRIVPASELQVAEQLPESATLVDRTLAAAMQQNPAVQQAQLGVQVAQINIDVAKNQKMPRLDLVGSARTRGLARDNEDAHDQIEDGQYTSYAVGLTLEYPLGNRSRQAEWLRRQWERRKATSILQNTADQVAVQVRERARKVRTSFEQLKVQQEAVQAARAHLRTLEESEPLREKLTPEFLLVKLQAQETYAQARRAEVAAAVEFNIALAELAQAAGTILDMRMVETSLSSAVQSLSEAQESRKAQERAEAQERKDAKKRREELERPPLPAPPWEMSPSF